MSTLSLAAWRVLPNSHVFLCKQTNEAVGMSYECVVSEVGLIGLLEPSLPAVAATPSGGLFYQAAERWASFRDDLLSSVLSRNSPLRATRCILHPVLRRGNKNSSRAGDEPPIDMMVLECWPDLCVAQDAPERSLYISPSGRSTGLTSDSLGINDYIYDPIRLIRRT